jgi:hypothetical protein
MAAYRTKSRQFSGLFSQRIKNLRHRVKHECMRS